MGEDFEENIFSQGNKIKFLCSHGGKILPRPYDGQLKYVGGITRIVAIPRNVTFSEVMEKLTTLFEKKDNMILKYRLGSEDLDTLVTVSNDEDLSHMLDEYDRAEARSPSHSGTPRLRTFLFPYTPIEPRCHIYSKTLDSNALERRYIDAINGITQTYSINGQSSSMSSIASPPKSGQGGSPDSYKVMTNAYNKGNDSQSYYMPKVQSSPSLFSLGQQKQQQINHHPMGQGQNKVKPLKSSLLPPFIVAPAADSARYQLGLKPQCGMDGWVRDSGTWCSEQQSLADDWKCFEEWRRGWGLRMQKGMTGNVSSERELWTSPYND